MRPEYQLALGLAVWSVVFYVVGVRDGAMLTRPRLDRVVYDASDPGPAWAAVADDHGIRLAQLEQGADE